MPPALSANSWIATLRGYHDAEDDKISTFSRMLSDVISVSNDDRVGAILDHYALQLISTGGFDGSE